MSHVCERLTSPKYAFKVKVPSLDLSFFKKRKKTVQVPDFFVQKLYKKASKKKLKSCNAKLWALGQKTAWSHALIISKGRLKKMRL